MGDGARENGARERVSSLRVLDHAAGCEGMFAIFYADSQLQYSYPIRLRCCLQYGLWTIHFRVIKTKPLKCTVCRRGQAPLQGHLAHKKPPLT